jgi:hypothetical protein
MLASILIRHHFNKLATMTPDTLNFAGDFTTILGFVGIISALVIVYTSFKRFYNSPYNVRVNTQSINETPEIYTENND